MLGYVVRGMYGVWCAKLVKSFCLLTVSGVLTVWQKEGTRGPIELESADIAAIGSEILYTSLTFQFLARASLDPVFTHHELRSFCAEVLLLSI